MSVTPSRLALLVLLALASPAHATGRLGTALDTPPSERVARAHARERLADIASYSEPTYRSNVVSYRIVGRCGVDGRRRVCRGVFTVPADPFLGAWYCSLRLFVSRHRDRGGEWVAVRVRGLACREARAL